MLDLIHHPIIYEESQTAGLFKGKQQIWKKKTQRQQVREWS